MPFNKSPLTKSQWKRIADEYIYGTFTTIELAEKYGVPQGAVRAHCWRESWLRQRNQFRVSSQAQLQTPAPGIIEREPPTEQQVALIKSQEERHAAEDRMDMGTLLPHKREQFLRETLRTAEYLLAQLKKRARLVDFQDDKRLKDIIKMLSDLVDTIRGPLALDDAKPAPRTPGTIQVNILNAVLEEADRMAGKQGRSPTGKKTIDL